MTIFQGFARKRAVTCWSDTVCQTHPSPHILLTPRDFHVGTASLWLLYETHNNLDFRGIIDEALKAFGGNLLLDSGRNHRNQGRDLNLDNEFYLYLWICLFVFVYFCIQFLYLWICICVFVFLYLCIRSGRNQRNRGPISEFGSRSYRPSQPQVFLSFWQFPLLLVILGRRTERLHIVFMGHCGIRSNSYLLWYDITWCMSFWQFNLSWSCPGLRESKKKDMDEGCLGLVLSCQFNSSAFDFDLG